MIKLANQPENELNLFGRPENLVGAADRMGSHRRHSSRSSNIRQPAPRSPPVRFPPDSRDRSAVCRSVAIRQEAETVDSQSRISTVGALANGHWLCRSLTATESRWRTTPCANRSVPTRMPFWRRTAQICGTIRFGQTGHSQCGWSFGEGQPVATGRRSRRACCSATDFSA